MLNSPSWCDVATVQKLQAVPDASSGLVTLRYPDGWYILLRPHGTGKGERVNFESFLSRCRNTAGTARATTQDSITLPGAYTGFGAVPGARHGHSHSAIDVAPTLSSDWIMPSPSGYSAAQDPFPRHSLGAAASMGSFGGMSPQASLPVYAQDRLMGSGTFLGVHHISYPQAQQPGMPPPLPLQPPAWGRQHVAYPQQPFAQQPQYGMAPQYPGAQPGYQHQHQHQHQHLGYGQQQQQQQYPPSFMQPTPQPSIAPPAPSAGASYPQVVPGGITIDIPRRYGADNLPTPTERKNSNPDPSSGPSQPQGRLGGTFPELNRNRTASGSLGGGFALHVSPGLGPETSVRFGDGPGLITPFKNPKQAMGQINIQNVINNVFGDLTDTVSDDPPSVSDVAGCSQQQCSSGMRCRWKMHCQP